MKLQIVVEAEKVDVGVGQVRTLPLACISWAGINLPTQPLREASATLSCFTHTASDTNHSLSGPLRRRPSSSTAEPRFVTFHFVLGKQEEKL